MSPTTSLALTAVLAAGVAVSATAQGVSVTDGNVTYSQVRPLAGQGDSPTASFTADPASDTNHAFENGWYYRIEGDAANSALKDDGTLTVTNAAAHSDADWTDVDNRGLIAISIDYDALSTGADSGVVTQRLTVSNISAAPLTIHILTYVDLDMCNTTTNSVTGTGNHHVITSGTCAGDTLHFFGAGADNWCIAPFGGSECGIVGGTNLDGSTPPFGPADYSGAFQWTFADVPANTTVDRTVTASLGNNEAPCPWNYDIYGVDCDVSTGTISIEPDRALPPVLPNTSSVSTGIYRNWPAGEGLILWLGINRTSLTAPGLGCATLLVEPFSIFTIGSVNLTDFRLTFGPGFLPNDPALCRADVHGQVFCTDAAAPNGIGGHSKAFTWTLGLAGQ